MMATSPPKSLKPWNESGGNCNNPCMSSLVLPRFVRIVLLPNAARMGIHFPDNAKGSQIVVKTRLNE